MYNKTITTVVFRENVREKKVCSNLIEPLDINSEIPVIILET